MLSHHSAGLAARCNLISEKSCLNQAISAAAIARDLYSASVLLRETTRCFEDD